MLLNYQYAHHKQNESEDFGQVTPQQALEAFDSFDWEGQSSLANELEKCSPTFSLIEVPNKNMIWVSSFSSGSQLTFVSECIFPGEVKRWFGLGSKWGRVGLYTDNFSIESARLAIEYYVSSNTKALSELYASA
jgi:hypothetical protein